jgi:hypothetical protein
MGGSGYFYHQSAIHFKKIITKEKGEKKEKLIPTLILLDRE